MLWSRASTLFSKSQLHKTSRTRTHNTQAVQKVWETLLNLKVYNLKLKPSAAAGGSTAAEAFSSKLPVAHPKRTGSEKRLVIISEHITLLNP